MDKRRERGGGKREGQRDGEKERGGMERDIKGEWEGQRRRDRHRHYYN